MRIYPAELPPVSLEPQAEDFCVVDVDADCGQGVVVLRSFLRGEPLFRMNGQLTMTPTLHSLQLGPYLHMDDPYLAGKVLHSCHPNSSLDVKTRLFVAERTIEAGDLLTMDYDATEDVLFRSFDCCCGELNCRGRIAGRQPATLHFVGGSLFSTEDMASCQLSASRFEEAEAITKPLNNLA